MPLQEQSKSFYTAPMASEHYKGGERNLNRAMGPLQKISQSQMEERRKKGLCYSCNAKWNRGHVCEAAKLFIIDTMEEREEHQLGQISRGEVEPGDILLEEEFKISQTAITGTPTRKTMRIVGVLINRQLIFLLIQATPTIFWILNWLLLLAFKQRFV